MGEEAQIRLLVFLKSGFSELDPLAQTPIGATDVHRPAQTGAAKTGVEQIKAELEQMLAAPVGPRERQALEPLKGLRLSILLVEEVAPFFVGSDLHLPIAFAVDLHVEAFESGARFEQCVG